MKFLTTHYHFNLLNDNDRLSSFYEAINDFFLLNNSDDLNILDIGCGSGILSYFIACNTNSNIIAIEKDKKTYETAKENLKNFKNIEILNLDILDFKSDVKFDLIICEMLDTALIDEEEVLALNHIHENLKESSKIIPEGIINIAELAYTNREYIHNEDDSIKNSYEILSKAINYSNYNFSSNINPKFQSSLEFTVCKNSKINSIKITTFTKLSKNIICGPTPMLNPPLFIPIDEINVLKGDKIAIDLEYIMGQGLETIKTNLR
ncbi:methyltransferase domain-containing protein [Methanobrevibacter sp. DSM 116169]|uniref:methyltransferase domain-containing protein n=1 Tax=Methanobrevibacter sp. DSM 116169 TaxID=3242727 RepID=UPI0038FC2297